MKIPALSFGVHSKGTADEAAKHGADDAKQHRHDDAAGIFARHQEFCDHPDDKPENNPPQNAEHARTSSACHA